MSTRLLLLLVAFTVSGCAATGQIYSEDRATRGEVSSDSSRLMIFRGDQMQYSARSVRIAFDGQTVGKVDRKGFNVFDVSPGAHTLTADIWDMPGKCELAVDLQPAQVYYFELSPRTESLASGLVLGAIGMAIESSGKECGGAFEIAPVPKEAAEPAIEGSRLTK